MPRAGRGGDRMGRIDARTRRGKGRFALAHNYDSRHNVIVPQGVESGACGTGQACPHLATHRIRA